MNTHILRQVSLAGISACVPSEVMAISDYPHFSAQEAKDFTRHVGIASKRNSFNKVSSDLCLAAAEKLLTELRWQKQEVGLLVLVTQSSDYLLPAAANLLQSKLQLSNDVLALDINLGCSGWVYGLSVTGSMMRALGIRKALLLAGETSVLADPADKTAFPLMGDAGTATALMLLDDAPDFSFIFQTDGTGFDAIIAPESGSRHMMLKKSQDRKVIYSARIDSRKVMEFCLKKVAPSIQALLEATHTRTQEVDYFIFHQANRIINEHIRKKINIHTEKLPYSIEWFGNTSSASIPLTMVTQLNEDLRKKKLLLLCSGFGVGLSIGNVLLKTDRLICPELIEI